MQTKSYAADADDTDADDADADGIHTKNNMSPTPSEGGHIKCSQGVVCPCPGAIYIYVYDHNIQTSSSLKQLGQSSKVRLSRISQISGERLQDHWSSGFEEFILNPVQVTIK